VYNNVLPASQLQFGCNYYLFKDGIEPKWEHEQNRSGGKWVYQIPKRDRAATDDLWLDTVPPTPLLSALIA
jgi:translation initiation factor 4E